MGRWLRAAAVAVAVGFAAAGGLGLLEAVWQWARHGAVAAPPGPSGPLRSVLPHVALYGWAGALLALLLLPAAAAFRARRAAAERPLASAALAAAGAAAALAVMLFGHLLRDQWFAAWWSRHGLREGRLLLGLLWCATAWLGGGALLVLLRQMAGRPRAWAAAAALAIAAVTLLWPSADREGAILRTTGLERLPAGGAAAHNLIVITIDAWRRDHLSLLNPDSPPTPHLDALAAESVLFTNAWAPAPWTLPSLAALQTGLPPRALGVRQYTAAPAGARRLAELAWNAGYATAAFLTNPYLFPYYGLDRGFARYRHANRLHALQPAERSILAREITRWANTRRELDSAEDVIPAAESWLQREGRRGPFYLWIHLLNPHLPYVWRALPAAEVESTSPPRGAPPRRDQVPESPHFRDGVFAAIGLAREGRFGPGTPERRGIAMLYAREVQFSDAWVGRLLASLRRLGLYENSLIVVTSDHGEELFDHGGFEHGHSLLPEVTGVPLIIRQPGAQGAGRTVHAPVWLLDLLPTFCARLGWPLPPERPGLDLGPLLAGAEELPAASARPLLLENLLYGPPQQAWLAWPWLRVALADGGQETWYDLERDPRALQPLAPPPEAAALGARMKSLASGWEALAEGMALPAGEASDLPLDLKRRLESLGY